MQLTITIKMDGSAFEENAYEAGSIVETLAKVQAEWLQIPGEGGDLRDTNGNTVGNWKVTK